MVLRLTQTWEGCNHDCSSSCSSPSCSWMLFAILWPTLRGGRTEDEQAVLTMVARDFPAAERPAALALIDDYCLTVPEMERIRVQRALLTLSGGDLDRLRYLTVEAKQ